MKPWWKSTDTYETPMKHLWNSWRHLDLPSCLFFGGNGYGFIDKEDGESMFAEASILSVSNSNSKKTLHVAISKQLCGGFAHFFHFHIFSPWLGKLIIIWLFIWVITHTRSITPVKLTRADDKVTMTATFVLLRYIDLQWLTHGGLLVEVVSEPARFFPLLVKLLLVPCWSWLMRPWSALFWSRSLPGICSLLWFWWLSLDSDGIWICLAYGMRREGHQGDCIASDFLLNW